MYLRPNKGGKAAMKVLDKFLQPQGAALQLRQKRMEILSSNIANAATPGYKARDIDFSSAYASALSGTGTLDKTSPLHLTAKAAGGGEGADVKFRTPLSTSLDGNTVELHVEQLQFSENAMRYEASLNFLSDRINGLRKALKGE
ncbi:flagellar basal body rod protein FlgB [Rhizobiales bacterium TNE-4]|nr:flagellar basal body rod protein FlgB [Rhizobiales bacterium TNE-4]MBV1828633.1 flagellar basal body rod protein FlgB [Rhizobiales bacterium TNE-4]